ncbi:MAG TPA: hypothetical protein VHO47_01940 [Candidatus Babeliales bacterium]|nr:hypothetical protein [Candidatus Babeliales bacterium]
MKLTPLLVFLFLANPNIHANPCESFEASAAITKTLAALSLAYVSYNCRQLNVLLNSVQSTAPARDRDVESATKRNMRTHLLIQQHFFLGIQHTVKITGVASASAAAFFTLSAYQDLKNCN